ncbi:PE-PGRS family protein [Streptomyces lincolnensis]|uniref:PE-PGRS family protein n=1 Tax=Streptomyces lincolnensis TaxID=1915 RepID=UPI0037CE1DE7
MRGGRDELAELLKRAGLEIVGDGGIEEVLPPRAAWRRVIGHEVVPAVAVRADRPDLAEAVNQEWHRLATELGVLGADGVFLVEVAGDWTGCAPRRWTRVRLGDDWDLAGALKGMEFMTLALDGDALVAATVEEYDVWLVAEDRIGERQEAEAQAAVRETPQERAAAWQALWRGPKPVARVLRSWAAGLALNRALPEDELRPRLLGRTRSFLYGALSPAMVDAAVAHPDWKIRSGVAEHQRYITPGQWARLILGEEDTRRRWALTLIAADRREELDEDTCRRLAADPSPRVREEAARLASLPVSVAKDLAADPEPAVRAAACSTAWPDLEAEARQKLLDDPHGKVRTTALLLHHREHPLPRSVFEAEHLGSRDALTTCRLERDLAEHLARAGERGERLYLADNPHLDADLVALLGEDEDADVRFAVSKRPDLTEEQRAGIRIDFDPRLRHWELDWVLDLHEDTDAMRRLAASTHPLVRRSVARARHLPPDVVERLARDEDRVVRLFLAESCDDAPADMLLEVWQWWDGSLTCPDRPRGHPNFPRRGLLRYADDPNPRMRRLAPDDPESTPELVDRLSRDPAAEVRYRAVTDPRLSAASAVRRLDDPHEHIRHMAAQHPELPARVLIRLLRENETAEEAARNPALPMDVMREMIERIESIERTEEGEGSERPV